MAYSKQTWDTTSYVNPTRMNHIEEGIENVYTDLIKKVEFTLSNSASTSISYPTGKSKNNMDILGFAFYRNYSWYFDNKASTCVCSNNEIIVEVDNSYSYIQGLPAKILYV